MLVDNTISKCASLPSSRASISRRIKELLKINMSTKGKEKPYGRQSSLKETFENLRKIITPREHEGSIQRRVEGSTVMERVARSIEEKMMKIITSTKGKEEPHVTQNFLEGTIWELGKIYKAKGMFKGGWKSQLAWRGL